MAIERTPSFSSWTFCFNFSFRFGTRVLRRPPSEAQEASCFATDVETVVAVLSDFKYSEALAEESVADEIRCQLKDQSMQIEELKAAIETELQTVRQQFEEAEVALESTKSSERQAVCELESKVNTLVEAQLKLQSVQDARKKVEKESRDELVVSDALHEARPSGCTRVGCLGGAC
eukprot:g2369.t1